MQAIYDGHIEIVELLLERGADINSKNYKELDRFGTSCLLWPCRYYRVAGQDGSGGKRQG